MVLYFSGTGNSRYVAQRIADHTSAPLVDLGQILKEGVIDQPLHSTRPFVFVLPTYGWRAPRVIEELIKTLDFVGNRSAYFVLTCGSSTYRAVDYIHKLCQEKGFDFMGFREIVMPENYIAMFQTPSDREIGETLRAAQTDIEATLLDITSETPFPAFRGRGWLFSHGINPLFYKFFVSDKGFYSTEDCISCGDCVALCPLNNVTLTDGRPQWQGNCTHCMACIAACPAQAIEYKNKTQGKPRYYFPSQEEKPQTPQDRDK